MEIKDLNGNQLWRTTCVIITPISYVLLARQIASEYMQFIEQVDDFELTNMLQIAIGNIIVHPFMPTHYVCERNCLNSEADAMVAWIAGQPYEWCSADYLTLEDDYLYSFCVINDTLNNLLAHSGKSVLS